MGALACKVEGLEFQNDKILIPIQYEDEHNSETENLALKGFYLSYSVQLHIHLV